MIDSAIEQLIHESLHGHLGPAERDRLNDWITQSPDNARAYYRVMLDEQAIDRFVRSQSAEDRTPMLLDPDDSAAARALAELARLHELGGDGRVDLVPTPPFSLDDATHKRVKLKARLIIAGSIAAVVALAALVGILASSLSSTQPIAQQQPHDESLLTVATLTGVDDAKWQDESGKAIKLRAGQALHAGQIIKLTDGLAELTTARGAVATLQSPCTIEFIDNDNALLLHHGSLVGLVKNDRATGFLVRTPHMDVTDLGTRFGVDATQKNASEVHVFEGTVEVSQSFEGAEPAYRLLRAGDAARATDESRELTMIESKPQHFAAMNPQRIELPGTGQGLAIGDTDPNWRVIAVDGKALPKAQYLIVSNPPGGGGRDTVRNDPAISQWLSGTHIKAERSGNQTLFTCRASFELPKGIDPDTATLVLGFDADEGVKRVRLNGKSHTPPANSWSDTHDALNTMQIKGGFVAGTNTIELDVIDLIRAGGPLWNLHLRWPHRNADPLKPIRTEARRGKKAKQHNPRKTQRQTPGGRLSTTPPPSPGKAAFAPPTFKIVYSPLYGELL